MLFHLEHVIILIRLFGMAGKYLLNIKIRLLIVDYTVFKVNLYTNVVQIKYPSPQAIQIIMMMMTGFGSTPIDRIRNSQKNK